MSEKLVLIANRKMDSDIAVNLKQIKPPALVYNVSVVLDSKVAKEAQKDAIMMQEFHDSASKVYEQIAQNIKSKLVAFDKLVQGMRDKNAPEAKVREQLAGLDKSIRSDATDFANKATQAIITDLWKKYAQKRKDYLKYQIGIVATITGTAAGLATSIALMAATPFSGGASAAIGIIGMVASCTTIVKEIASAALEVETASKLLEKQVQIVAVASKNLATKKFNEYSSAVLNQFVGIGPPSCAKIAGLCDTCEKKLAGLEIKTRELGKTLNKILEEQQKLKREFMSMVHERAKKYPSTKALQDEKTIEKKLDEHLRRTMKRCTSPLRRSRICIKDCKRPTSF